MQPGRPLDAVRRQYAQQQSVVLAPEHLPEPLDAADDPATIEPPQMLAALSVPGTERTRKFARPHTMPCALPSRPSSRSGLPVGRPQAREDARRRDLKHFLETNGFFHVNVEKRSFGRITYPLHEATRQNTAEIVQLLLEAGPDPQQTTTTGKTAQQIAESSNKEGSHDVVLAVIAEFLHEASEVSS